MKKYLFFAILLLTFAVFLMMDLFVNAATYKINVPQNNNSLSRGLVGYWSFDGKDMAGDTAYDRSGQGNNGTLTNSPIRTIGRLGQALSFDGVNDYVNLGDVLNLSLPVSFSMWLKPSASSTALGIISTDKDLDIIHSGVWAELNADGTIGVNFGSNAACAASGRRTKTSTNVMERNTWSHLVFVINGATDMNIYINNIEAGGSYTGSGGNIVNTSRTAEIGLVPGCGGVPVNRYFLGFIDEVRVYNRALSGDEIKRLYNIGTALKLNKPNNNGSLINNLVGYWSFDGNDMFGATAIDRSGQGKNGTLTNGPVSASGKIGQALNFNVRTNNQYVTATNPGIAHTSWTIGFWAKLAAGGTNRAFAIDNSGYNDDILIQFGNLGSNKWGLQHQDNNNSVFTNSVDSATTALNIWTYITAVSDGSTQYLYVNGILKDSDAKAGNDLNFPTAPAIQIGANVNNAGYFKGLIDDVRIYNRALSADTIKRLYNLGR